MTTPRDRIEARLGLTGPPLQKVRDVPPRIPDHELIRRIGQGAYGEVWLARNALGTWRAVKIVYRDNFKDERPYEREFAGIRRFEPISRSNEGFVDVLQVGRFDPPRRDELRESQTAKLEDAGGWFYYVMELADAGFPTGSVPTGMSALPSQTYSPRTLARDLAQHRRLPLEDCLQLGLTLTLALGHLHRHGLIHRDIKPGNIIFVGGVPKLADIGLVTEAAGANTFVGTEGFVPPEGPTSPQADLYALGKVLYEAAMGKDRNEFPEPFTQIGTDSESVALMELNAVLLRACAPDPKKRYVSAEEMHADLALLHSGGSVKRRHQFDRQFALAKRIGAIAIAAALLVGGALFWQHGQTQRMTQLAEDKSLLATEKAKLASENSILAQQAQANAAEARQNELVARGNLYAADINLAHQALKMDNLRQARGLLQIHVPKPGETDLRGFEWRYLWEQCYGDELLSLPGHTNGGRCIMFSADGRWLASGGRDEMVKLWDLTSRREISTIRCAGEVVALAFSPKGRLLAVATTNSVSLWDTSSFRLLRELPGATHRAAFSPDGRYLLTSSLTGLIVWQTEKWNAAYSYEAPEPARLYTEHIGFPAAFSSDGKRIAAIFEDMIRLFTIPNLQETRELATLYAKGPSSGRFVAFSPDNKTLATLSATGYGVQLWDIEGNRELRILAGHSDHVLALAFSPGGIHLATCSADQTIKLWEVATGTLIRSFKGQADVISDLTFSPDGQLIASIGRNDGVLKVWDANAKRTPESFREPFGPVGFDTEGRLIAFDNLLNVVTLNPGTFESTKVVQLELVAERYYTPYLGNLAGDGRTIGLWRNSDDRVMDLFDTRDGKRICSIDSVPPWASFAPRRRLIATDTHNNTSTVWQLPEGAVKWVFTNKVSAFQVFAFSPDEEFILTDERMHLRLWRISGDELELEKVFNPKRSPVSGTAFSPDGRLAATGEQGALIKLWSIPSCENVGVLSGHTGDVIALAFSPDGRTLASMCDDRTVRLWHIATRRELVRFQASKEDQRQFALVFSPDGRALAARRVDEDGPITWIWHAPSLAEIAAAEAKH